MPANPKPSQFHLWASGPDAAIAEPLAGEKALGWYAGQAPPAPYMNWIETINGAWAAYVDTFEQNAFTWPLKQTFTLGADMGAKLTVLAGGIKATGPVVLTGDTSITGALTATGAATVGGALTVSSGGAAVTGNSSIVGTVGITGATTVAGILGVSSDVTVGGTFGLTGNAVLGGTAAITGNTTVGGTLGVTGAATVGSLTTAGNIAITGGSKLTTQTIDGVAGNLFVNGNMRATGEVEGTTGLFSGTVTAPTFAGEVSTEAVTFLSTLLNSWTTAASTSYYYKDRNDRLWIYLEIEDGADLTNVFVLPVGYRPIRNQLIVANQLHGDGTEVAMLLVNSDGSVRVTRLGSRTVPGAGELLIVNGSVRLS